MKRIIGTVECMYDACSNYGKCGVIKTERLKGYFTQINTQHFPPHITPFIHSACMPTSLSEISFQVHPFHTTVVLFLSSLSMG